MRQVRSRFASRSNGRDSDGRTVVGCRAGWHHENWASRDADECVGDAPEEYGLEGAEAARANHDHFRPLLIGHVGEALGGISVKRLGLRIGYSLVANGAFDQVESGQSLAMVLRREPHGVRAHERGWLAHVLGNMNDHEPEAQLAREPLCG
jgi:hypothetical protein